MIELNDKNILLFAPKFFNYDIEIKKKLESFGAKVDLYDERPSSNFFIKSIIRLYKRLIAGYSKKYFDQIIQQNQNKKYNYILVIKGEVLNISIVKKLKSSFPDAVLILYLWDSIRNYKDIKQCLPLFDRTLTFDLEDSYTIPSLIFRPLFFIDDFAASNSGSNKKNDYEYDLLFIGTVHSDRWVFLRTIKEAAIRQNLNVYYYLYIQSPVIFLFRKMFDKKLRSLPLMEVRFKPVSKDKVITLTEKSRAVLDIQHPKQTGLTIRTIEVTGARRKLITTNSAIKDYDFFSKQNILIVDRNNPLIPDSFWIDDYSYLSEEIYNRYSISGWLKEIFDL